MTPSFVSNPARSLFLPLFLFDHLFAVLSSPLLALGSLSSLPPSCLLFKETRLLSSALLSSLEPLWLNLSSATCPRMLVCSLLLRSSPSRPAYAAATKDLSIFACIASRKSLRTRPAFKLVRMNGGQHLSFISVDTSASAPFTLCAVHLPNEPCVCYCLCVFVFIILFYVD